MMTISWTTKAGRYYRHTLPFKGALKWKRSLERLGLLVSVHP